jgi:hypothetical protein
MVPWILWLPPEINSAGDVRRLAVEAGLVLRNRSNFEGRRLFACYDLNLRLDTWCVFGLRLLGVVDDPN